MTGWSYYTVYGLRLRADVDIPGLLPEPGTEWDVEVRFTAGPPVDLIWQPSARYASRREYDQGESPWLETHETADGNYVRLTYTGTDIAFVLSQQGTHIWIINPDATHSEARAIPYLLGPVLGFVLRLRGVVSLHASAVVVDGQAVAFMGPVGAGKSTLAALFAAHGCPVITDDVLPLLHRGNAWWVQPGYPRLRLWPPSLKAVNRKPDGLPPVVPGWDKRYLDLDTAFHPRPLPLARVYILVDWQPAPHLAPRLERAGPQKALFDLMPHTYTNYLLDRVMQAHEFSVLSDLAQSVPVYRVTAPNELDRLPMLRDRILENSANG
jgi:hypothetical protein